MSDIENPIIKGTNRTLRFTVIDSVGPIDLSSAEITFSVKKYREDSVYSFQRQNAAAGGDATEIDLVTDGTDGQFDVFIIPTNTSTLDDGEYFYDAMYDISGAIEKKPWEKFIIKEAISV